MESTSALVGAQSPRSALTAPIAAGARDEVRVAWISDVVDEGIDAARVASHAPPTPTGTTNLSVVG